MAGNSAAGEPSTSSVELEAEEEGEKGGGGKAGKNLQLEIDGILEETARKKNLSVMNVKSILRVSGIVVSGGVCYYGVFCPSMC